ncbi:hypothetical protein A8F95_02405 [Bacillus wudalianchiensis]|uniref:Uncharacterized protein n=1 Tax=Pseudobacillus wudalianchiensis TaxID=1743143 RepID=A0A1B9B906_9BACI|nr:hypothetical protein A8F95_02405 [Bacillus wudalianchiensis]
MSKTNKHKIFKSVVFSEAIFLGEFLQKDLQEKWEFVHEAMARFSRNNKSYLLKINYADIEYFIHLEEDSSCVRQFKSFKEIREFIKDGCHFFD